MCFKASTPSYQTPKITVPDSQSAQNAVDAADNERRRARGLASTILTTPATAAASTDQASLGRKMLLGA